MYRWSYEDGLFSAWDMGHHEINKHVDDKLGRRPISPFKYLVNLWLGFVLELAILLQFFCEKTI